MFIAIQIIAALFLLIYPHRTESKFRFVVLSLGVLVFAASQYALYANHDFFLSLFPPAQYGVSGILAEAQYKGISFFADYAFLQIALVMPLIVFGIAGTHMKRKPGSALPSDVPHRASGSESSYLFLRIVLWFHVLFVGTITILTPASLSAPAFILLVFLSTCVAFLEKKLPRDVVTRVRLAAALGAFTGFFIHVTSGTTGVLMSAVFILSILFSYRAVSLVQSRWAAAACMDILMELVTVGLAGALFALPYVLGVCGAAYDAGFDSQNFLTWFYTALNNIQPNHNTFYLYGFFTYLQDTSALMRVLGYLYIVFLFVAYYGLIRRVTRSSGVSLIFLLFLMTLLSTAGFWTFYRYSTAPLLAAWYALMLLEKRFDKRFIHILFGFAAAACFFLFTDQGIIAAAAMLCLLAVDGICANRTQPPRRSISSALWFSLGVAFGITPFITYLFIRGSLWTYAEFFSIFSSITQYGKLPYDLTRWITQDFYISLIIWTSVLSLGFRVFVSEKPFRLPGTYVLIGFTIPLAVVQFKDVTRPIASDILIPAFLAYSVLAAEFYEFGGKTRLRAFGATALILGITAVLFSGGLNTRSIGMFFTQFSDGYTHNWVAPERDTSFMEKAASCIDQNARDTGKIVTPSQRDTMAWLEIQPDYNGKLFSFPGDPIFYLLSGQTPPPFFNAYDATPQAAQRKNIAYLEANGIAYAVYNTENDTFMDAVPNVMRNSLFTSYLLTRYAPVSQFGTFVILRKHISLTSPGQWGNSPPERTLRNHLSTINLESIPKLEGKKLRDRSRYQYVSVPLEKINAYLSEYPTSTDHLMLGISRNASVNPNGVDVLTLFDQDNREVTIQMNECLHPELCAVHLERLPLFYTRRLLRRIELNVPENGNAYLISLPDTSPFW